MFSWDQIPTVVGSFPENIVNIIKSYKYQRCAYDQSYNIDLSQDLHIRKRRRIKVCLREVFTVKTLCETLPGPKGFCLYFSAAKT